MTNASGRDSAREVPDAGLTFKVIGLAQHVHQTPGPGFPENVYHRAVCQELLTERIPFESEKTYQVFYKGALCGEFRPDLVVAGALVVEWKALSGLTGDRLAQALSYLKASGLRLALLLNFGRGSLETKRVIL